MKRFFTISGNDVKIFAYRSEAEHESDRIIELELVSKKEGVGVAGVEGVSFIDWEDLRNFVKKNYKK